MLAGLIDSDGTVSRDNLSFLNTNLNLIQGVAQWLDILDIKYYISTRKSTNSRWKDLKVLTIRAESIKDVKINLRVAYKKEQLKLLQAKAIGGYTNIDSDFVLKYESELRELYSRAQFSRLKSGKCTRIRTEYYKKLINRE